MEAAAADTSTNPDHVTVEIPSNTAEEDKTSPAPESTATGLSITETASANIVVLTAAVHNSNQQPQIQQPPPKSSSRPPTPKSSSRPPTPKPTTPTTSILRKRFSVSGSGVANSYPYPVDSPDPDDDDSQSSNNSSELLTFWKAFNLMELAISAVVLGLLIASLNADSWKHHKIWDLHLWKWCVLFFVILGGRLASELLIGALVFFMQGVIILYAYFRKENNSIWTFTPKEKFIHITFGLKTSFQVFIWLASVLLAWGLILDLRDHNRSQDTRRVLNHITRALAGCLVGTGIWLVKAWIMELAAYNFIVERSKQRIIQSIFDQETLKNLWDNSKPIEQHGKKVMEKDGKIEKVTNDFQLKERIRRWTPSKLVDTITMTELPVIVDGQQIDSSPERMARATADELFARLTGSYDAKYVDTDKVLASLKEEYKKRIPVGIEEGGFGQVSRSYFRKWAVKVQLDRLLLLRTLNGRDNAVGDLNRIATAIVLTIIVVVWLLVMGFLTTQVMLLLATQIVALNFMFNNTARTIFEAVIFVFVTRPFDVGDLCSIDDKDEQVVVHDMNILSTIFKKSNGERLFYPNAVLMSKSITNYYGMPETSDSVEFTIAARTRPDQVKEFKDKIQEYLKSKPKHWRANDYTIVVEDTDRTDKSVGIYVDHVVNFYNGGDRKKHRKELLDEVNKIIDDLKIECHSEPQ